MWKEIRIRLERGATVDQDVQSQIKQAEKTWRDLLKRILDCILYLYRQDIAFRGHAEHLTDEAQTPGNLLALIKDELDLMNLRGQVYDNAATMTGVYRGFQQRIFLKHKGSLYSIQRPFSKFSRSSLR